MKRVLSADELAADRAERERVRVTSIGGFCAAATMNAGFHSTSGIRISAGGGELEPAALVTISLARSQSPARSASCASLLACLCPPAPAGVLLASLSATEGLCAASGGTGGWASRPGRLSGLLAAPRRATNQSSDRLASTARADPSRGDTSRRGSAGLPCRSAGCSSIGRAGCRALGRGCGRCVGDSRRGCGR